MEPININLMPAATRFELQRIEVEKKLKKIALIVVVVWLVILGLIVGGRFYFDYRLKKLDNKKKNLRLAMNEYSGALLLQQPMRARLTIAARLLESRELLYNRLNKLFSYLPEDMTVKRLTIKSNTVELSSSLSSLVEVRELEKTLEELGRKKEYSKVVLTGLSQNKTGGWSFSLEVKQ